MRLSVEPEAEGELEEAAEHYELNARGLGLEFLAEMRTSTRDSTAQPWKNFGVPYALSDYFYVTAALTLEPGVELHMPASASIYVSEGGALLAVGTEEEPLQAPVG